MDGVTVNTDQQELIAGLLGNAPLMSAIDRLIVVDNDSTDDSVRVAEAAGATVIKKQRHGYGQGVNLGARQTRGDFFAIINPDIRFFEADSIERLMRHFDDPRVALVAPALQLLDGSLQDSARITPSPWNLIRRRRMSPRAGEIREAGDVDWIVGAFYVVRRSAWEEVGGFDESYFLYFDDVDLCERLHRRGWKLHFDPDVVIQHAHQGASRKTLAGFAMRHHIRSASLFFLRNPRYVVPARLRARFGTARDDS